MKHGTNNLPATVEHGKDSTYCNYACRCAECRAAHREQARRRRRLPTRPPRVGLGSTEVCAVAGCSYRQLDHWCRTGYLGATAAQPGGSGVWREFSDDEVRTARALVVISNALGHVDLCRIADAVRATSGWPIEIHLDGVTLLIAKPEVTP